MNHFTRRGYGSSLSWRFNKVSSDMRSAFVASTASRKYSLWKDDACSRSEEISNAFSDQYWVDVIKSRIQDSGSIYLRFKASIHGGR